MLYLSIPYTRIVECQAAWAMKCCKGGSGTEADERKSYHLPYEKFHRVRVTWGDLVRSGAIRECYLLGVLHGLETTKPGLLPALCVVGGYTSTFRLS